MRTHIKRFNGICIFIVFAILALYPPNIFSAVPEIINYQGSLSDNGGNPINATVNITFTLYDDAVAGSTLWQETQSVIVTNGQFSVELGADGLNPLSSTIFEDPIFLGIQVDADAEMAPRQAITAVGYAFRAKTVENDTLSSLSCATDEILKFNGSVWVCAADNDSTDTNAATICPNGTFLNGDGTCDVITDTNTTYSAGSGLALNATTFSIPANGINASHLATNSVGTSEIGPGTVGASEIGNNAVGSSEVINNSLTSNDLGPGSVGVSELSDLAKGVGINGSIVIPASAFQPVSETQDYVLSGNGYVRSGSATAILCLLAPVSLPHGVTVTHFEISVIDNLGINTGPFALKSVGFASETPITMASISSSGASPSIRVFFDNTIAAPVINGFENSYYIQGCVTADQVVGTNNIRLYGARIRYN